MYVFEYPMSIAWPSLLFGGLLIKIFIFKNLHLSIFIDIKLGKNVR